MFGDERNDGTSSLDTDDEDDQLENASRRYRCCFESSELWKEDGEFMKGRAMDCDSGDVLDDEEMLPVFRLIL